MDKESDIEVKYQRLATEYSKIRSQVTVLKKAVLEEQTRNAELTNSLKNYEQTVRKRDQEMESLTFRNEQLSKRISVLQQDLQTSNSVKKSKNRTNEVSSNSDVAVFNEEFQKKILENAQLYNNIAEKETEIVECREKMKVLEDMVNNLQTELTLKEKSQLEKVDRYKKEISELEKLVKNLRNRNAGQKKSSDTSEENFKYWKTEAERWKSECDMLKSKPEANDKLTNYYESQLSKILEANALLGSETKTAWAENGALLARLENVTLEHDLLKSRLDNSCEELKMTCNNYKSQLDAMTEHLAAQNEKITSQCDEIQFLKHKLSLKK